MGKQPMPLSLYLQKQLASTKDKSEVRTPLAGVRVFFVTRSAWVRFRELSFTEQSVLAEVLVYATVNRGMFC
jgi:hypothetical protein